MRNAFLPPIPELDIAASLLDDVVKAVLDNDYDSAKKYLIEADVSEICEYSALITGPINLEIHWQTELPPSSVRSEDRAEMRMPSAKVELDIANRDGWRCRFCEVRVISKKARNILHNLFPEEARWGRRNHEKHCALAALTSSLDHLLPHSRGGSNNPENLVTACGPCQFGRNQWTLVEVGFNDPRDRMPMLDSWDGLNRLLQVKAKIT